MKNRQCNTRRELHDWLRNESIHGDVTIKFDFPDLESRKASVHLVCEDETVLVIRCFYWNQTKKLREAVKFGSNHASKPIAWKDMRNIIYSIL